MKNLICILALLFMPAVHAAFEEGLIVFKISNPQGSGNAELKVSKTATRAMFKLSQLNMNVEMDFLIKHDNPNIIYQINDKSKSYSVMDVSSLKSRGSDSSAGPVSVKVLGKEKVLGYNADHLMVEMDGNTIEMWVSKEIGAYSILKKLQSANSQALDQMRIFKALEEKGLEGFPLKTSAVMEGGRNVMEVIKIENKKFPADLFSIPEGYTKTQGMSSMIESLANPENMQALQEMMKKNLTPEQLQALQKMMQESMQKK